jgi:HEPN domain-containing protein
MEDKSKKLFKEAAEKLKEANKELYRPEEDIVSYLVCKNAQYAIKNYLSGYLLHNGIDTTNYDTIDSLYEQCVILNKKFKKVNLSEFNCTAQSINTTYCNEVSRVSSCLNVADSLDTFLRHEKIIG